jgi:hypothetical protein
MANSETPKNKYVWAPSLIKAVAAAVKEPLSGMSVLAGEIGGVDRASNGATPLMPPAQLQMPRSIASLGPGAAMFNVPRIPVRSPSTFAMRPIGIAAMLYR